MNMIIITAISTIIGMTIFEVTFLEAYRYGRRAAEQEFAKERTKLEDLINEYQMKLAEVRARENQAKKLIRQWQKEQEERNGRHQ